MKNRIIITENEKSRILEMHRTATKKQYLNEGSTEPDYSALYGKTVKFTPVKVIQMRTEADPNPEYYSDTYSFEELKKQPMSEDDKEFLNTLETKPINGVLTDDLAGRGPNAHYIGVKLEPNVFGNGNVELFQMNCGDDTFSVRLNVENEYSNFNKKTFDITYKCDGLKKVLDGIYPCKTDFAKVDSSTIPDNLV